MNLPPPQTHTYTHTPCSFSGIKKCKLAKHDRHGAQSSSSDLRLNCQTFAQVEPGASSSPQPPRPTIGRALPALPQTPALQLPPASSGKSLDSAWITVRVLGVCSLAPSESPVSDVPGWHPAAPTLGQSPCTLVALSPWDFSDPFHLPGSLCGLRGTFWKDPLRVAGFWEGTEEQVLESHKPCHLRPGAGAARVPATPRLAQGRAVLPEA